MPAAETTPIRLPVGVRDFLPRAAARRRAITGALLAVFDRWGYERIITPAFEYADVLARGLGADARAAAIRFVEPATGEVVALRPDITPQIARVAATRLGDVRGPIRLCYEGSVLRLSQGARGQRELIQCGVELIDAPGPDGDAEAIALAAAALAAVGQGGMTMDVGHVALARAALAAVVDPVRRAELRTLVSRKDRDGVARAAASAGLPPRRRKLLEALPGLYGEPADVLARARAVCDGALGRALDDLQRTVELAANEMELEGFTGRITLDLGDLRGFEYYTGVRFSGYVEGVGDAVLRGGRYDDLIGRYGRDARATGFAVDVEAIALAQKHRGVPGPKTSPGVLVVELGAVPSRAAGPGRERAFAVARALRAAGRRAAVDLGARRGDAALASYAAAVGLDAVLVLDGRKARLIDGGIRPVAAGVIAAAVAGKGDALVRALTTSQKRRA